MDKICRPGPFHMTRPILQQTWKDTPSDFLSYLEVFQLPQQNPESANE